MTTKENNVNPTCDLRDALSKIRPEFEIPGFWERLEGNCTQWAADVSAGFFWAEVKKRLPHWRSEYRSLTKADLLVDFDLPHYVAKPTSSIINKLARYNKKQKLHEFVPIDGLPVPKIGDIVRTRIRCQYIDGVEFLANKLEELSVELNVTPVRERQGKIEGYFAQHLNIRHDVTYREAGHGTPTIITCEIQIASALASQMWQTSHSLYENVRNDMSMPDDWQWKPNDPRFISNQLGHMLHLADGLLVQLRESKSKK